MVRVPIVANHFLHIFDLILLQIFEHSSPELSMHKPTIKLAEAGDIVEDVAPEVKVIPLANDQPFIIQRQL